MENNSSENSKELSLKDKISFIQNYQRTFKNWESNYQKRVIEFINQYEDNTENIFVENEIENTENVLLQLDQALKDNYTEKDDIDLLDINPMRDLYIDLRIEYTIKSKSTYKRIKAFLEQRKIELKEPQQTKINKPNSRNDIFVDNAIELFKYYYDCKNMVNSSRVDFRFLYEVMKKDGYIHDTVTLGQYITFIHKDFGYVDKELKVINMDSKPNLNRLNDYKRYKEQTITTNIKERP